MNLLSEAEFWKFLFLKNFLSYGFHVYSVLSVDLLVRMVTQKFGKFVKNHCWHHFDLVRSYKTYVATELEWCYLRAYQQKFAKLKI